MKYFYAGLLALMFMGAGTVYAQEVNDLDSILKLSQQDDIDTALERLDSLIAADGNNVQARFVKGLLLLEQGDTPAARDVFAEIVRLFPRLPEAFNNLASIYAGEGEYERARQALLSAIANAPDYPLVRTNLGDLYAKMAVDAYRQALELDPADAASQAKLRVLEQLFTPDS